MPRGPGDARRFYFQTSQRSAGSSFFKVIEPCFLSRSHVKLFMKIQNFEKIPLVMVLQILPKKGETVKRKKNGKK